jgi:hypothetical protein
MTKLDEIDYGVLIDRSIKDFPPIKRIWPVSIRLSFLILLEAAILALVATFNRPPNALAVFHLHDYGFAGFLLINVAAAWMALRTSIPGRESSAAELVLLATGIIGAASIAQFVSPDQVLSSTQGLSLFDEFHSTLGRQWTFAALPWLALFWAARHAMPLRPRVIGGLIGVAASSFAIAAELFSGDIHPINGELLAAAMLTGLSLGAGAIWLDSERLWRVERGTSFAESGASAEPNSPWFWTEGRGIFPVAAALAAGLLLVVLKGGTAVQPVPDFDLAIANYQQSLLAFHPNVPSSSLETVLAAYIEHGMPSYMWDFGPQGYKLLGGRFEHLPDGAPATFTWFRGPRAAVLCMFKQVSGFAAPPASHSEIHHLLFYRYRGYSVCLINVGGYGDFVSVIVSPIPMKQFMQTVVSASSLQQH